MRVAVGQFGAPTPVVNASLCGVIQGLVQKKNVEIYAVLGGPTGLACGKFIEIDPSTIDFELLRQTPGAALLAGRRADFREVDERAVDALCEKGIDALIVIGGNGTMSMAQDLFNIAKSKSVDLQVVGVPKTIDNDIVGIDHTPGFPSAAQFVLQALRDLSIDLEAMVGFEQVRVVEVMGRNTGWLAATAFLLSEIDDIVPVICIPELDLNLDNILTEIQMNVKTNGRALVVVSEGVRTSEGEHLVQISGYKTKSSNHVLGGIGRLLASEIIDELGFGVRYENLGLLQRCWADCQVPLDVKEATELGYLAASAVIEGKSGVMATLLRKSSTPYQTNYTFIPFISIANQERKVEQQWLPLSNEFREWLRPLINWDKLKPHFRLESILSRKGMYVDAFGHVEHFE